MPNAWGFKDRQTAELLADTVRGPRNIGRPPITPRQRPWKGGRDSVLIKTPPGGIPAATGSGPYVWGSATCTVIADDGTVGSDTLVVKNIVNQPIAGNVPGKADAVGSIWVIDVASCGSGEE